MRIPDRFRFWRWPILLMLVAVVILPMLAFPVHHIWDAWQGERALSRSACPSSARCVTTEQGVLGEGDGRHRRRDPFPTWSLLDGDARIDSFDTSGPTSDALHPYEGESVTAKLWHGQVVALELPSGEVVRSTYAGWRGMASGWGMFAFGLAFAIFAGANALTSGRSHGWFSTRPTKSEPYPGSPTATVTYGAIAPGLSTLGVWVGVRFTDSFAACLTLTMACLGLGIFAFLRANADGDGSRIRRAG